MSKRGPCRKSARLKDYDYSRSGAYFVTICTERRRAHFDSSPELRDIVQQQWRGLESRFPEIKLDEFVIMPNHLHGIIFVVREFGELPGQACIRAVHESPRQPTVGAIHELPPRQSKVRATHELPLQGGLQRRQGRQKMLLPKVVGYFKMNTAKRINQALNRTGQAFWARNYYEHVVRNEDELRRIREYIRNNPLKWELDRENPESKNFGLEHDVYWREVYG